jgi:hypothetical protein
MPGPDIEHAPIQIGDKIPYPSRFYASMENHERVGIDLTENWPDFSGRGLRVETEIRVWS